MTLKAIRANIDKIDEQIHDLLNQRATLAIQAGMAKLKEGTHSTLTQPKREQHIEKTIAQRNAGPLTDRAIIHIFRAIILECRQLQIQTYQNNNPAPTE